MPKDQDLGYQRSSRPEQPDQRRPNKAARFPHRTEALRDSASAVSPIRFTTGTPGAATCPLLGRCFRRARDVIAADGDGVLVILERSLAEPLEGARNLSAAEVLTRKRIETGESLYEIANMDAAIRDIVPRLWQCIGATNSSREATFRF
jgi:hypothetical protein